LNPLVLTGIGGFQSHEANVSAADQRLPNGLGNGQITGPGRWRNLGAAMSAHGLQVKHSGAASLVVTLQGSVDGVDWFTLATWTLGTQANGDIVWATGKPVCLVRANIVTLTGGGAAVSTWVTSAGGPGAIAAVVAPSAPDLANLKVWLKADAGTFQDSLFATPASANNDPVGGWQDQSGNGNHVIQATAGKRPLLKTAAQNGLPTITFDGVDDFLQKLYGAALSQPLSIFLAINDRSSAAANTYLFDDATGSLFGLHYTSAGTLLIPASGTNNLQYAETLPTGFTVYTWLASGASSVFRRDRVQKTAGNGGANTQTGLSLATAFNGTQAGLIDLGEVLIYGADETANFAAIENYLKTRWGTP